MCLREYMISPYTSRGQCTNSASIDAAEVYCALLAHFLSLAIAGIYAYECAAVAPLPTLHTKSWTGRRPMRLTILREAANVLFPRSFHGIPCTDSSVAVVSLRIHHKALPPPPSHTYAHTFFQHILHIAPVGSLDQ